MQGGFVGASHHPAPKPALNDLPLLRFLPFSSPLKQRGRFLISLSMAAKAGRALRTKGVGRFLAQEGFWEGINAFRAITMSNISAQMLERLKHLFRPNLRETWAVAAAAPHK